MKVIYEKVDYNSHQAFNVQKYSRPYFETPWHFHPEYEIVLILKGYGKRFVADNVEEFTEGDLIMIKGNVPHFWMSDNVFYKPGSELKCESIYIQFLETIFPDNFKETTEFENIRKALNMSEKGIRLKNQNRSETEILIKELYTQNGIERILKLYGILELIGQASDYKVLGSKDYANSGKIGESEVLNKIDHYLTANFKNRITLDEIAEVANYSPAALCRYFRSIMNKSMFEYLNEIRINYACKLLLNQGLPILQVGYESGFNSISHFNKQFRKIKGISPKEYRSKIV